MTCEITAIKSGGRQAVPLEQHAPHTAQSSWMGHAELPLLTGIMIQSGVNTWLWPGVSCPQRLVVIDRGWRRTEVAKLFQLQCRGKFSAWETEPN